MRRIFVLAIIVSFLASCAQEKERVIKSDTENISVLKQLPVSETNIDFNNKIVEDEIFNTFTFDGLLQGSGVGVLDVNNDGLEDIYFAASTGQDKLYLNEGNLKFTDISEKAGISKDNYYSSGVTIVDINQDGYDDIYVCRFLRNDPLLRTNKLYVNQKDGTFKEDASNYGIADTGYSTSATFFDMDGDNDLDLYVGNQPPNDIYSKEKLGKKIDYKFTDRLYRNNGDKFQDVTKEAGITNYCYTLSVNPMDYDSDGDIDLMIAADYYEPDLLYQNNGDGTFTNVANESFRHISYFSMGTDIADINNDGLLDIYTVDMVAEDNFRQKTNMSGMNPEQFWKLASIGYHYQYMFNSLQLNNGNGMFSEIGQLGGISNTDWSWAPLFLDFDQDGYQDLYVTNGVFKEVRNKDYEIWKKAYFEERKKEQKEKGLKSTPFDAMKITQKAPSVKLSNYLYKNNGDLTFTNVSKNWNIDEPSWSCGAAYADFDNDGDMDLVVNNSNMPAFFYQNMANEEALNNYTKIKLNGPENNKQGLGATIIVSFGDNVQKTQINPYRGYMSSSQPVAHVGLGPVSTIDKIEIIWPDKKKAVYTNLEANKELTFDYSEANSNYTKEEVKPLLAKYNPGVEVKHSENEYDDYLDEILLPHKMSTLGPVVAVADINNDGNDDFYLGGSAGSSGKIYLGKNGGKFELQDQAAFSKDMKHEDGDATFFDADGDGDLDLYVCSGGNEFSPGNALYQDRLYTNNNGKFSKSRLPKITESSSTVAAGDYDGDGDMDLFVGGRQVPGKYGYSPKSCFLKNNNGTFSIDSEREMGMITDAKFVDFTGDKKLELVTCGEWNPIQMWSYNQDKWEELSEMAQLEKTNGWWNKLRVVDIDGDGDQDILAGNLGMNIKFKASEENPFKLFVDDFDGNGSNDVYLGYYAKDGKCYPVRGRQCSSQQMPFVKKEFKTYNDFGSATIDDVLEGKLDDNTVKTEVYTFQSIILENNGSGKFNIYPMVNEAQVSPLFGFAMLDVNKDGKQDFIGAGNYYNREVETTRSDAGMGVLALAKDNNEYDYVPAVKSGLQSYKDVREVYELKSGNEKVVAVFNNNDVADFYRLN